MEEGDSPQSCAVVVVVVAAAVLPVVVVLVALTLHCLLLPFLDEYGRGPSLPSDVVAVAVVVENPHNFATVVVVVTAAVVLLPPPPFFLP